MHDPRSIPNPANPRSALDTHREHNHCHHCSECQSVAGGWYACEKAQCDDFIDPKDILHWEPATETVKRLGKSPLQICQYSGTC